MAHFLFATIGTLGDVHPYIAVASALMNKNHQASIATVEEYRGIIEEAGIRFVPLNPSIQALGGYEKLIRKSFHPYKGMRYLIRFVLMRHLRAAYAALSKEAQQVDLIISHPLAIAAPLVAERMNLPWVSTVLAPFSFFSKNDPPVFAGFSGLFHLHRFIGKSFYYQLTQPIRLLLKIWEKPLTDFRTELDLPENQHSALLEGQYSPLLNLALFDDSLAHIQTDWPINTKVCGAPLYYAPQETHADSLTLQAFLASGDEPLVFALGSSAVWIAEDFWEKAVSAALQLGKRAILITGKNKPTIQHPDVCVFSYLPYEDVFPYASAIIHQGGIGTLSTALRSGKPQFITPIAFDQPDNAYRTVKLGIARTCNFSKLTTARMVHHLEALLTTPQYASQAVKIAQHLTAVDGSSIAAQALINCLEKVSLIKNGA